MQISNAHGLTLASDGGQLCQGMAATLLPEILAALRGLPEGQAGVRIHGIDTLRALLDREGNIGSVAASFLGDRCRPVRAVLFDKTGQTNWSLGWHQDRTVCVQRRVEVDGYGPWTTKGGMQHVVPPFELLARMVTLRIHLDDVPADNAPLLIAPGSHLVGRIPVEDYDDVVARCGIYACLARAGDIWAYATPVLHASKAAKPARRRRVLQVDYSVDELAGGLKWLGI